MTLLQRHSSTTEADKTLQESVHAAEQYEKISRPLRAGPAPTSSVHAADLYKKSLRIVSDSEAQDKTATTYSPTCAVPSA